jgi:O-antigen/teichoic acid export membrane protein
MSDAAAVDQVRKFASWGGVRQVVYSVADQGFSVGGMFLINLALARTQTKEEYGVFALSYSIFTFLAGMHNAAILEAYTVYGAGRYHAHFAEYSRILRRANFKLCFGLSATLLLVWGILRLATAKIATPTTLGLVIASGILLVASFIRRTLYIQKRPDLAALFSGVSLAVCVSLLLLASQRQELSGFTAFMIAALSWCVGGLSILPGLRNISAKASSPQLEPAYWEDHWRYSRWVFVTALVFQFTGQAYYWLAAIFLSVRDVGELRAIYNLATPVDQIFSALVLLILPMMSFRFASQRLAGLLPLWRSYLLLTLVVTFIFAIVVNIFGKSLMRVLYDGKFDDVAPLLGILVFLPLLMGMGNTVNAALKACERPQSVFVAYVASGIATFLFGLPLILRFGLRGAVYGMLLSGATYTITLSLGFLSVWNAERRLTPTLSPAHKSVSSATARLFF